MRPNRASLHAVKTPAEKKEATQPAPSPSVAERVCKVLAISSFVALGIALIILVLAYFKGVGESTQTRFRDNQRDILKILEGR